MKAEIAGRHAARILRQLAAGQITGSVALKRSEVFPAHIRRRIQATVYAGGRHPEKLFV